MSCLFDSISYFLKIESSKIREQICNYISKMRSTTTWGGSNEILAACNIWKIKINVYLHNNGNKKIEFTPLNGSYIKIANIVWFGNHYEPLTTN